MTAQIKMSISENINIMKLAQEKKTETEIEINAKYGIEAKGKPTDCDE